jgi:polygalacturonase
MPTDRVSRRRFLRTLGAGAGAALVAPALPFGCRSPAAGDPLAAPTGWELVPGILRRIQPPVFPGRDFDIARHGATGDGVADCTAAFRRAIDACHAAGGGHVVVPPGRYLSGAIHLRSNVDLHVTKGATIAFSREPAAYPLVFSRWEGVELMNYSPFVYAFEQENVAITGEGTLDGQADAEHWWPWKGTPEYGWTAGAPQQKPDRDRLLGMAEGSVPVAQRVFGAGTHLRPQFIQPYRCRNVLIEGVTIHASPMWEIHPVLCTNVTVRGVTIATLGPNNDGCNPESCRDVLIENCSFQTGDDCIAIKSGRNADGRRLAVPSENIIVRGCHMQDGHGGVTIGSEISGGVRNVFAERCRMDSPRLDRALRLKNNAARGGVLEHIYMRDVTIGQLADAVLSIDFTYEEGADGTFTPVAREIELRRVTSKQSQYALYLRGFERAPISGIRVVECAFDSVAKPNVLEHVRDLRFDDVKINGTVVGG